MTIAVYAGSFDPFTYGHYDILLRSTKVFEKVIIAVAHNAEKSGFLSCAQRLELIKLCTKNMHNTEVYSFDGLTTKFAGEHGASILIRGIRNYTDFEYENQLAQINLSLDKDIQTLFFISKPEHSFISSSAVRELISNKSDLSGFIPAEGIDYLYKICNY